MKRAIFTVATVCCLAMVGLCYGQDFTAYVGTAMPPGDFGNKHLDNKHAGFAKTGYVVGAEYAVPIRASGLFGVIGISTIGNGFDGSEIRSGFVDMIGVEGLEVDLTMGSWNNIPIMAGLKYQSEISPWLRLYGTGQAGINIIRGPKFEMIAEAIGGSVDINWKTATSLGFGIGGGAVIYDRINIGMRYLRLGEANLKGTFDYAFPRQGGSATIRWKELPTFFGRPIGDVPPFSVLLLTVGLDF